MQEATEPIDWETPFEVLVKKEEGIEIKAAWDAEKGDLSVVLAEFVFQHPQKWHTVKAWLQDPRATRGDLAFRLGISRQTVINHLQALKKFMGKDSLFVLYKCTGVRGG